MGEVQVNGGIDDINVRYEGISCNFVIWIQAH